MQGMRLLRVSISYNIYWDQGAKSEKSHELPDIIIRSTKKPELSNHYKRLKRVTINHKTSQNITTRSVISCNKREATRRGRTLPSQPQRTLSSITLLASRSIRILQPESIRYDDPLPIFSTSLVVLKVSNVCLKLTHTSSHQHHRDIIELPYGSSSVKSSWYDGDIHKIAGQKPFGRFYRLAGSKETINRQGLAFLYLSGPVRFEKV